MLKNTQPVERPDRREDGSVVVHSIFYTIQGEGPYAGCPAIFVRLAGCNLQCPMCDTEYTSQRLRMDPDHVAREIDQAVHDWASERGFSADIPSMLVVITGGEPFRQNLVPLVTYLLERGLRVQIETNGSYYQELPWQWTLNGHLTVVCSPKTHVVNEQLIPYIKAFKYVATAESLTDDGLPRHALEHPSKKLLFRPPVWWSGVIYLQPVDEKDDWANRRNRNAVVQSCMKHDYRLCLQVHKIIEVE